MIFLRNVLRAPARSLLTALGVAAGVAMFVATSALILDVRTQIGAALSAYQTEVVVYERRATEFITSRISSARMAELEARYGAALSPMVIGNRTEEWNPYVVVIGVRSDLLARTPLSAGVRYGEGSGQALLGEIAATRLGIEPGGQVTLNDQPIRITGIYRTGSRLLDGGVMLELPHAQRILTREGAEPDYTIAVLRAGNPDEAQGLIADLNRQFPMLRAVRATELAGGLRLLRVLDAFARTISAVVLAGTCLLVTNTFLMAIAARTREIGILMAVGWTPWLVLRMLFAEGLVLCAAGAALGNLLALILLRLVNSLDSIGFGWTPIGFPGTLTAASFGLAGAVAAVALAWPAVVLYRMQPLTALRHE